MYTEHYCSHVKAADTARSPPGGVGDETGSTTLLGNLQSIYRPLLHIVRPIDLCSQTSSSAMSCDIERLVAESPPTRDPRKLRGSREEEVSAPQARYGPCAHYLKAPGVACDLERSVKRGQTRRIGWRDGRRRPQPGWTNQHGCT